MVEVTMAIGIIAFAFVALFGLLPTGLTTMRNAIDTGNESRILQNFVGKVQVTDFSEIQNLSYPSSKEVYFFDEEGSMTDTSVKTVSSRENARIYAAKLFIEDFTAKKGRSDDLTHNLNFSVNVMVVFTLINGPGFKEFETIETLDDLRELLDDRKNKTNLRTRSMLVSKMDAYRN